MVRDHWQGLAFWETPLGSAYYPNDGHFDLTIGAEPSAPGSLLGYEEVKSPIGLKTRPTLLSALFGVSGFYTHKMEVPEKDVWKFTSTRYCVMESAQDRLPFELPVFINGQVHYDAKGVAVVPLIIPVGVDVQFKDYFARRVPCNNRASFPLGLVRTYTNDETAISDWSDWFTRRF